MKMRRRSRSQIRQRPYYGAERIFDVVRYADLMQMNVKVLGYELARHMAASLPVRTGLEPRHVGLSSSPSRQADLESDWAAYWLSRLGLPVLFHRKLWELAYVIQALYENGMLTEGRRGLGFGCGMEPLPSLFAGYGVDVVATDMPEDEREQAAWSSSGQYSTSLEALYRPELVGREAFERHVTMERVDMRAVPASLTGFDFCWSVCALEHLGSINGGLNFIERSLDCLRPGGVAVHTTEFNFLNDEFTIESGPTVLYQRQHLRELHSRLTAAGHNVAPLDFNTGTGALDRFVDLPPFYLALSEQGKNFYGPDAPHIKVAIDGFTCTCFGLIVRKGGG